MGLYRVHKGRTRCYSKYTEQGYIDNTDREDKKKTLGVNSIIKNLGCSLWMSAG